MRARRQPLLLTLVGLLACIPVAAQDGAAAAQHTIVVDGVEMATHVDVDTRQMEEVVLIDCTQGFLGGQVGGAESGAFEVAADGSSFTFSEPAEGNAACGQLNYNITFLPGPEVFLRLRFESDRIVTDNAQGLPRSLLQELRLTMGDELRSEVYIPPEAGSNRTTVERAFLVPPGIERIGIGWYFEDRGVVADPTLVDPGAHGLTVHIRGVAATLERIPLPLPVIVPVGKEMDGEPGTRVQELWANVSLPPQGHGAGRSSSIHFDMRAGPKLLQVLGPGGAVPAKDVATTQVSDRALVELSNETTRVQGPGVYSFRLQSTRVLPPPPPIPDPATIEPFYYTMVLLPAPAAMLSVYSGVAYRQEAEGRYRRAAAGILATILVSVVYYLILVLYTVSAVGMPVMTELPLAQEATLVYGQLVVLLLFFAVTAVVVGRYLARAMRRDIEERRRKEDQLRRSNEELERFAYVASHDLQEPLRKVAGFTALLQKRYTGRLDKDADEIIQYAVDGATRMQMLIKDILAYSRVGSKELQRVPVDANATMQLVVSDLGEQIKDQRAEVTWDALPTVRVDASQLRQILQNLVENAIKYRHPNRRPKVRVSAADEGHQWRFSVADNGQGIPADKHEEIFGIFRRLHGQDLPGTGIGLAVVKKAIERHGGKVWVESARGKGSTFHFTIPRSPLDKGAWTSQAQGSSAAASV